VNFQELTDIAKVLNFGNVVKIQESLLTRCKNAVQQPSDERQGNAEDKSPPKSVDLHAVNKILGHQNDDRIDDQSEKPKCKNSKRKSEQLEYRFHHNVQNAQNDGKNNCSRKTIKMNA